MTPEQTISKRHSDYSGKPRGILIFELRTGTGFSKGEPNRIDAFFMEETPSKGLARTAYEIKVSRSDFLRELKQPLKRRAAMRVSNQFFFVMSPGIAKPEEIPMDCGLIETNEYGGHIVVDAPFRDGMPASWHFFAAVARRLLKMGDATPKPEPAREERL